jgi:hypothetical protein
MTPLVYTKIGIVSAWRKVKGIRNVIRDLLARDAGCGTFEASQNSPVRCSSYRTMFDRVETISDLRQY